MVLTSDDLGTCIGCVEGGRSGRHHGHGSDLVAESSFSGSDLFHQQRRSIIDRRHCCSINSAGQL